MEHVGTARPADPALLAASTVAAALGTDLTTGLTAAEAADRFARDGANELLAEPAVPAWRRILAQLADPLIYLLLGAIVVSGAAWVIEGAHGFPFDVVVIAAIVALNAVIGYVQESRAAAAVAALATMAAPHATVVRDGATIVVPTREVVVGDLLVLSEGDTVAADARLVASAALRVAEASLTGESEAVLKDPRTLEGPAALGDRFCMVFAGTAVAQGSGRAIVTATATATEMGHIADLIAATEDEPTPLQREIAGVGRMLGLAVLAIAGVVIATVLLTADVHSIEGYVTVLLLGVSLAVAAVPEGLPAILSVVLAIGVQRLAGRGAIVKRLSSVETLGSATVICTDKTGTLTRSEMTVQRVVTASGEVTLTGEGYAPAGEVRVVGSRDGVGDVLAAEGPHAALFLEVAAVLGGGSLANDSSLREHEGDWVAHGDPTEIALRTAEHKLGTVAARSARFERVATAPFTSERKLMSTIERDREAVEAGDDAHLLLTKGAPDVLLARCSRVRVGADVRTLDDEGRATIRGHVDRLSDQALRTLAVAYRPLEGHEHPHGDGTGASGAAPDGGRGVDEGLERDLVYLGTVGIIDPPRPEARDAIAEAHRAGVRVVMITGDHPGTARRIAEDLHVVGPGSQVVTGPELDEIAEQGPESLAQAVRDVSVFARVAPRHKLDIVDLLQADGEVVAMTGDGVNDAPALKSADIGVAMGVTGTEVSKEAASMILADDNFATIVVAVEQGRGIFDNIRKFLRFLLSSNMGEVLTVFLGVVLAGVLGLDAAVHDDGSGLVLPLLATQILWINLLTDTGPALAMGVDPTTEDVMARRPRRLTEKVIDGRMWRDVVLVGLVMALASLTALDLFLPGGLVHAESLVGAGSLDVARTAAFTVLVLCQLFNAFAARSETVSAAHAAFANVWLWGAVALALVLQVAVVHVPFLNTAFGTTALTWEQWLICFALASSVLWVTEVRKLALRAVDRGGRLGA